MRLIKPKAELIEQVPGLNGIYTQIELAGRTCYKSEDKIMDVLSINEAHLPENITINDILNYKEHPIECIKFLKEHNIKYNIISSAKDFVNRMIKSNHTAMLEHGTVYLSVPFKQPNKDTNAYDVWNRYHNNPHSSAKQAQTVFNKTKPEGFVAVTTNLRVLVENNWLDDLQYICEPTGFHEKRYTFKVTTSIGVTREFNRHKKLCAA